jgi:hypothetical protein
MKERDSLGGAVDATSRFVALVASSLLQQLLQQTCNNGDGGLRMAFVTPI